MTYFQHSIEESEVLFAADGHCCTRGLAYVRQHGRARRAWHAIRAWVACWAIAAGAFLLPARLVAVPLMLVAGPIAAVKAWNERTTVVRTRGTCPTCGDVRDHVLNESARPVMPILCEACGSEILVSPGSALLGLPDEG